ncbi:hypothetical protein S40293_03253 [Stachybotrys chartarum IBT 40293]|nr:hypothetical protein S40293_03253 [Stachybotrys chartarum IBT 40293]KFA79246.1 hypothetical protein S40288_02344 [Stachybotrys chartarum IBT 40288]
MANLSLPRILCLHGGGVNARVFELQCRAIIARLGAQFRFVFVDGPFPCQPHPAILAVYGEMGPFYRWLRWLPDQSAAANDEAAAALIREQVLGGMRADRGTGPWVGVLGFSQGAKIAASLLWAQQRVRALGLGAPLTDFRFGVLMAGSPPVVNLDPRLPHTAGTTTAARLAFDFDDWPERNVGDHVVHAQTLHVHGLRDPDVDRHRQFMRLYFRGGTVRVVEWDGDHRLPIKTVDVEAIAQEIEDMADESQFA